MKLIILPLTFIFLFFTAFGLAQTITYSESKVYQPREFPEEQKKKNKKKDKEQSKPNDSILSTGLTADTVKQITLPVSVFGSDGQFHKGLTKDDFTVFVDDKEVPVLLFGERPQITTVVLMIDTSPSTAHKLDAVKSLAKVVLNDLGAEPHVAIVEFSGSVRLLSDVTKNRDAALKAIDKAAMGDGTALYGSMDVLFQKIAPKLPGRKIAILLSDGVDTVSRSTYANSLLEAEKSDIAVYSIYMDTFSSASAVTTSLPRGVILPQGIISGRITAMNKKEYDKGLLYLNDLADLSGGRVVSSEKFGSLAASFKDEFSFQYYISFSFQDSSVDRRSSVRIRVNKPGLTVQARGTLW